MKCSIGCLVALLLSAAVVGSGCGTYHLPSKGGPHADMGAAGGNGGAGGGGSGGAGGPDGGGDGGVIPIGDGGVVPARTCDTTFTFSGTFKSAGVAGEWNAWDPTKTPLTGPDAKGNWTGTATLMPGAYAYKIVTSDGTNTLWSLDPGTPYTKFVGGVENSVVEVDDCHAPQLQFKTLTKTADGTLHAEAQYVDGAGAAGVDVSKVAVLLDGAPAAGATIDGNGLITVDEKGLGKTKHRLVFSAADKAGHAATDLHVPFWIEDQAFDFRDGLLYFAFTDRFRNGDTTNDGAIASVDPRANFQGGDFAGIKAAIDEGYFDSLGVRTIWVSPPNANPTHGETGTGGHLYSGYHAYWPTAGRTPDTHFGTLDTLKAMVQAAHNHGIRVIVDAVLNHVHSDHPYWAMHQNDGWFNPLTVGGQQCICGTGPANGCGDWNSTQNNGNHGLLPRQTCWFEPYMPDLDYENWDALTAMIDDALFWARDVDVDGFRVDAVKHFLPLAAIRLRSKLHDLFEHTGPLYYLVGETFDGDRNLINSFIGPHELSGQFDFPIYFSVINCLATYSSSLRELESATAQSDQTFGSAIMSPFLGNHDVSRFLSTAAGMLTSDPQGQAWSAPPGTPPDESAYFKQRLALTFVATSPGIPLVYYGDEYGQPGAGDPDNRRFMKWSGYSTYEQNTLTTTQKLGAARKELAALRYGTRRTLWIDDNLYVYARVSNQDLAIVVINRDLNSSNTTAVPVPADLALPNGTVLKDRLGGAAITVANATIPLNIGPHSSAVLAP